MAKAKSKKIVKKTGTTNKAKGKSKATKLAAKKPAKLATQKKAQKGVLKKTASAEKKASGKSKARAEKATSSSVKQVSKTSAANTKIKMNLAKNSKDNLDWSEFLTPLDDRIIVEMSESEKVTAGGIIIPDTAGDTSGNFKARVLAVGRGHRDKFGKIKPMDVKIGDIILFTDFSGAKVDIQGKNVRILRESEVLGIINK